MTDVELIVAWFEEQAAKERELFDSGRSNNPALTQERWIVYKISAQSMREGAWKKLETPPAEPGVPSSDAALVVAILSLSGKAPT